MSQSNQYVGLDVALKETSICVIDDADKIVWRGRTDSLLPDCPPGLQRRPIRSGLPGTPPGVIADRNPLPEACSW